MFRILASIVRILTRIVKIVTRIVKKITRMVRIFKIVTRMMVIRMGWILTSQYSHQDSQDNNLDGYQEVNIVPRILKGNFLAKQAKLDTKLGQKGFNYARQSWK